jgi:hypothetical protein
MTIQESTFHPLPPREAIEAAIKKQRDHIKDLTSYLCYLIPLAEKCGDKVYDIAARSLSDSGVEVTAARLKELATYLTSPEGEEDFRKARLSHTGLFLTTVKDVVR